MNEEKESQEETVVAPGQQEIIKKMEEATKRLEAENAKLAKARAELEMKKVEAQLGGSAEAGHAPVTKSKEELIREDVQNWLPEGYLPQSLRKKK